MGEALPGISPGSAVPRSGLASLVAKVLSGSTGPPEAKGVHLSKSNAKE
jgi:hypothetical protein